MSRDVLFLLEPGFSDPKHPGRRFVCPHGLSIEGLLASAPDHAGRIDVKRIGFERPRHAVIDALDDAHQGLPVLVLGRDQPAPDDAQTLGDVRFVTDARRILELLAERHGFPVLH
ncbi:hypothetical protein C5615_26165 [Burkholderia cepacia]|uniref:DUF3088 domain-containing protein n=1 Tax=Burkholderia cepacia TaxID=292 RepID=A0A2S8II30_BURCE|nr:MULTISPECIES: DUF3088 domain-containing protein [Burkholderia]PQP14413.1 hypothetical protein C5615_26165 [Burkholderia cepacia]UOB59991.1 DUF3088 domain-containing protein [Burkholderia pyrrocinia]HDR9509708.1 DUF3088 domain-containing protein [Burkholderia cepacia]